MSENTKKSFSATFFRSAMIVVVLLGAALFLRSLNMNKILSGDETILMDISGSKFAKIVPALKNEEVYPPLTFILLHYWMHVSRAIVWVRLYFVLFGLGCCFLIYFLGKEYLGVKLARISLLLSVLSPLLIFSSQYVRSYIDSAFLMLLSTLFMLKIIKGKQELINWIVYVVSAVLSLYTFYFSFLLIFCQFIFILIFKWKEKRFILTWCLALIIVGLIFLPWVPSAIGQFKNASSVVYDWSDKGFNLGVFRFGLYTRNIFSLFGFDPYFMVFRGGISMYFSKIILGFVVISSILGFSYFFYLCFSYLKSKLQNDRALLWFFFFLTFSPLALSWLLAGLLNTMPNARYLVSLHALFLILVSIFLCSLLERKHLAGIIFTFLVLIIFALRIPDTVCSEFEIDKAVSFLKKELDQNGCLICIYSCPPEATLAAIIKVGDDLTLNENGSRYIVKSSDFDSKLKQRLSAFKKVYFYRVCGSAEIFGANDLLDGLIIKEGFKNSKIVKFKNIDIVEYKKKDAK